MISIQRPFCAISPPCMSLGLYHGLLWFLLKGAHYLWQRLPERVDLGRLVWLLLIRQNLFDLFLLYGHSVEGWLQQRVDCRETGSKKSSNLETRAPVQRHRQLLCRYSPMKIASLKTLCDYFLYPTQFTFDILKSFWAFWQASTQTKEIIYHRHTFSFIVQLLHLTLNDGWMMKNVSQNYYFLEIAII